MGEATISPSPVQTPPVRPNAEQDNFDVRISRTLQAQMQVVPDLNSINPEKWDEIEKWLIDVVKEARKGRDERWSRRREKWRKTLAGERYQGPFRRDASNISVPLTIWASAAIRARVRAGTIESNPLISVEPNASTADPAIAAAAKQLVTFFTAEFRNPRALNGEVACDKVNASNTPIGMAGLKVHIERDGAYYAFDPLAGKVNRTLRKGRVRWEFLSPDGLLYPLGFGTDVRAMPFVGHETSWTTQELLAMREGGYLDDVAVKDVTALGSSQAPGGRTHIAYQSHHGAELYFDFPLYDDGLPVALVAYFHIGREKLLGLRHSTNPRGERFVWLFNFDMNPDPESPEGQGVCEKLEGTQDETDLIHNLGIESAKRAIAHIIVLKEGRNAAREFGNDDPIMPGDHVVTENPAEDVVVVPLGSPDGMTAALAQEANSLKYVMRFLGLDESALGNVESGKRVPASLGLEIKKDSRVITAAAITNMGNVLTEATYATLELYRQRLPMDTLSAAVGEEGARLLTNTVFSANEMDLRSRFIINFNASDAAMTEEARKQQLIVVGQYLQAFYDRVIQYAIQAAQMPPPLQAALMDILKKMQNGTRALLNTIDDVPNPEDLLPSIEALEAAVRQASAVAASGGAPGGAPAGGGSDMGAGIV